MKREAFEELIQGALDALAAGMVDQPVSKASARRNGIGGIRFGEAERNVGHAVAALTFTHRTFKPIAVPSPEMVPPCF